MRMRHVVICGLPGATLIFNFISERCDFGKEVIENKMYDLIFSTTFVWNISHSETNLARYDQKCVLVFMQSNRYSCQIVMKLEFSRKIFEIMPK